MRVGTFQCEFPAATQAFALGSTQGAKLLGSRRFNFPAAFSRTDWPLVVPPGGSKKRGAGNS
jgi:hypothetical protein